MEPSQGIQIPYGRLAPETLRSLLEEFVTRDGTELSEAGAKIEQVLVRLRRGEIEVWFDEDTGSCNLLPTGAGRPPASQE